MQHCALVFDIFKRIIALDEEYLPANSFLALRATCRQMKSLFTKQKYLDKYVTVVRITSAADNYDNITIVEIPILPNGKYHGLYEIHRFGKRLVSSTAWLGDIEKRQYVANDYDLPEHVYLGSRTARYYLGNITGPWEGTLKLIGCNHLYKLMCVVDNIDHTNGKNNSCGAIPTGSPLEIEWEFSGYTLHNGCLEFGCSKIYDYKKFTRVDYYERLTNYRHAYYYDAETDRWINSREDDSDD